MKPSCTCTATIGPPADQRAPSTALPGQAQTHRLFSPEALPSSAYTVLRAPVPSGLPGVSPGPGGTTSSDNSDQALWDQYNVTLCPDIQEYVASGKRASNKRRLVPQAIALVSPRHRTDCAGRRQRWSATSHVRGVPANSRASAQEASHFCYCKQVLHRSAA
jgi:hypothetical protein